MRPRDIFVSQILTFTSSGPVTSAKLNAAHYGLVAPDHPKGVQNCSNSLGKSTLSSLTTFKKTKKFTRTNKFSMFPFLQLPSILGKNKEKETDSASQLRVKTFELNSLWTSLDLTTKAAEQ